MGSSFVTIDVEEVEVGIKQFPQSYALKGDHARVAGYHGLLHATELPHNQLRKDTGIH